MLPDPQLPETVASRDSQAQQHIPERNIATEITRLSVAELQPSQE